MSKSKHFEKIAWATTAVMLAITILFMNGASLGIAAMARTLGYENRLFDNTKVHTIDIVMDDWDKFISTATSEEYSVANLAIDGEAYKNVGIRGKGNTSLSSVASMGSQRYSFKVEFDRYDETKSYHGLDKLSLNNLIQDTTMMKDYLTYTMMNEFGAAAPLCSFVYITVNGNDWGLYLAVEGVEDSFLERNYGTNYGNLYKPDSMGFGGGRGNGKDFDMNNFMGNSQNDKSPEATQGKSRSAEPARTAPSQKPPQKSSDKQAGGMGGFGGGFGMGSSDVKLQYAGDSISSYQNIWNNAKTDITEADQLRLISSLEKLSNGEDIESVVDIESVIRYFVVHNFVCNGDSYTGSMIHNYYLYEEDGKLAMLPWDYNLAYGTFQGTNAQSTVNTPIDSPTSGSGEDRPMWYWIAQNEEYTNLYHEYFAEFLDTVDITAIINNAYDIIKPYVKKDPTAFYGYDAFEKGVETMRNFCALRTESIRKQLENSETVNNMSYVNASSLTLSAMGSMGGGMGGFGGRNNQSENAPSKNPDTSFDPSQMQGNFGGFTPNQPQGERPSGNKTPSNEDAVAGATVQVPEGFGGQMPEGFDPSQMFGGEMPEGNFGNFGGFTPNQSQGEKPSESEATTDKQTPESGASRPSSNANRPSGNTQIPNMNFGSSFGGMASNTPAQNTNMIWLIASALFLAVGLIIAKLYKY